LPLGQHLADGLLSEFPDDEEASLLAQHLVGMDEGGIVDLLLRVADKLT